MWVAELGCEAGHGFEGYFASRQAYDDQQARGLVACPVCGSAQVTRRLSAPRINVGAAAPPDAPASKHLNAPEPTQAERVRHWLARLRAESEDVGSRFAQEARRMHEGDVPERAIRGHATAHEVIELLEDGVPVVPLPSVDPAH